MDMHNYHIISRRFLEDFEVYQLKMLRFDLNDSLLPMKKIFNNYLEIIKNLEVQLGKVEIKSPYFIIKKRIKLLIMHIEMILPLLEDVDISKKDPFEIIRIFDKQHIFKKVLFSHLEDLELLLKD